MGDVGQDEGNPCQKEIPDQAQLIAGFAVGHTRYNQENAYGASGIQQNKDGQIMSVPNNEVAKSVDHRAIVSLPGVTR